MPLTAATIQAVALVNPHGVSIDLRAEKVLTGTGFCVAYAATQNNFGPHGLVLSMAHANGPHGSGIIGAWTHGVHVYYDSVKKYETRHAAVEAAKKEGQLAIFNLNAQVVENIMTPIPPDGTPLPNFSFRPSLATGRKRAHSFSQ